MKAQPTQVGIVGLGAIGREIAMRISDSLPQYEVAAVATGRRQRAMRFLHEKDIQAEVVEVLEISQRCDLVIECAPASVFRDAVRPAVQMGKRVVILSVGALLENWDIVDLARETGGEVLVPSGAIMALDAVQAANIGTIESVEMRTRKPVEGLLGAPQIEQAGIDLLNLEKPMLVYEGTAREAISGFPANLNVSIALSLAGLGPDRTRIEVWADPSVRYNTHEVSVHSDSAHLSFKIENIPTENAATGKVTPLSVVALLKKMASPIKIGT